MAVVTHLDNITVDVNLSSVPPQVAGFYVLYLVDLATNSLNSNAYVTYTDLAGATADSSAGYISATTYQALQDVFAQSSVPSQITVAAVDLASSDGNISDTYSDVIDDMVNEGIDFYVVDIQDRDSTDIAAVSAKVESLTKKCLFFCQSSDSDWGTSGYPAALSALSGRERTVVTFHDDDAEHNDLVWPAKVLSVSPDNLSATWNTHLAEVTALAALTSTQKGFLDTNYANHGARLDSTYTFQMDPGKTTAGRQIAEIVSADWFAIRVQERLAHLLGELGNQLRKLPINLAGVELVKAVITQTYLQGVAAGHFEENQLRLTSPTVLSDGTINPSDIAAEQIRVTCDIQLTTGARILGITANLSRTAVN